VTQAIMEHTARECDPSRWLAEGGHASLLAENAELVEQRGLVEQRVKRAISGAHRATSVSIALCVMKLPGVSPSLHSPFSVHVSSTDR
jgi:hypothetical protein